MADKRPKKITRTTPPGSFKWPKLVAPDEYKGKKAFKTGWTAPADDPWVGKAIKAIDKMADDELAKAIASDKRNPAKQKQNPWKLASKPYENETDKEGNETGRVLFKFKANFEGTRKDGTPWKHKGIPVFDANGKKFKLAEDPWSGTEDCITFEMRPYSQGPDVGAGVSLSIEAVQIIKLVQGGEKDAEGYGFGKHDGGFDADDGPQAGDNSSDDDNSEPEGNVASAAPDDEDF